MSIFFVQYFLFASVKVDHMHNIFLFVDNEGVKQPTLTCIGWEWVQALG